MHSVIFRTKLLKQCGLKLPEHTFYVDNIYVFNPLPFVKNMYYLDVNFYYYYIGREDQSVNQQIMLSRIDQQLKVNRLMLYELNVDSITNKAKRDYLYYYTEIVTQATVSFLLRLGTKEDEQVMQSFLDEIQEKRPAFYEWILGKPFYRHTIGPIRKLPHWFSYPLYRFVYLIARRVFGFN